MKVPVLLIVFNRIDTAQQVFASIRQYQPEQLFIAADGPRPDRVGEAEKCQAVRLIPRLVRYLGLRKAGVVVKKNTRNNI